MGSVRKKKVVELDAPIFKRILAFIIDLLIIHAIVLAPINFVLPDSAVPDDFWDDIEAVAGAGFGALDLLIAAISILFFVWMEIRLGATPGKKLLHLKVVSLTDKPLRRWQAYLRSLFLIPAMPFSLLYIIDPLFMIFNKNHQRLSEILSKSKVVGVAP